VVCDSVVDRGQEWRQFDDDGPSKSRIGGSVDPLLAAAGLQSSAMGTRSDNQALNRRMGVVHKPSHLEQGLWSLASLGRELQLPQCIIEKAREIFATVHAQQALLQLPRRNNMHSLFVCIYYHATRAGGVPQSIADLGRPVKYTSAAGTRKGYCGEPLTRRQFNDANKRVRECAAGVPWLQKIIRMPATQEGQLERHLAGLQMPYRLRRHAVAVLKKKGNFVAGHRPQVVMAAAAVLSMRTLCPGTENESSVLAFVAGRIGHGTDVVRKCVSKLEQIILAPLKDLPPNLQQVPNPGGGSLKRSSTAAGSDCRQPKRSRAAVCGGVLVRQESWDISWVEPSPFPTGPEDFACGAVEAVPAIANGTDTPSMVGLPIPGGWGGLLGGFDMLG